MAGFSQAVESPTDQAFNSHISIGSQDNPMAIDEALPPVDSNRTHVTETQLPIEELHSDYLPASQEQEQASMPRCATHFQPLQPRRIIHAASQPDTNDTPAFTFGKPVARQLNFSRPTGNTGQATKGRQKMSLDMTMS